MLLAALAWTAPPASATPPDAADIVAALKRTPPSRTAYAELRWSSLLERPLLLRGELEYLGPGRLGKRVDAPWREQITIADGRVRVERPPRKPRSFALGQAPELAGFLNGFSALLGGDAQALQREFELNVEQRGKSWRLRLVPLDPRLARRMSELEVDGVGGEPHCFRSRDADGDRAALLVGALATVALPAAPEPEAIEALCRGATP